ncbi:MAG: amidohydrolase [Cyclobacteriaceae bacterium]|nr:amidohydrolase [Cyclobacteriaceae bacterium]
MIKPELIQSLASRNASKIIKYRRHLHSQPELSFEEYHTASFIRNALSEIGLDEIIPMAETGTVGIIRGNNPESGVVALRADIDALPIYEENEVPYKSKNPGCMHACGHDVHTASLLGTAAILLELKQSFEGTVKLIFQPGEEKTPGGASLMIKEGVLENPKPGCILGQHVMPLIPVGEVGFREGLYMASADELYVTVFGKGGHAAMPDHNIDPVLITAHMITALQQIVSRACDPKLPTVLSFGKLEALGATNVIPDKVYIEGTFRTMNETWRAEAHQKMKKMATAIAEGMGGSVDFNIVKGYPFLKNDVELTRRIKLAAIEYLGQEKVHNLDMWMAAEDFAFYTQQTAACFYRLGTRNEEKGITAGVHTSKFDVDEKALEIGAGLMAWFAIKELS